MLDALAIRRFERLFEPRSPNMHASTAEDRIAMHKRGDAAEQSLLRLKEAGIGYEPRDGGQYLVAGTILFYSRTGYWRMLKGPAFGYGVDKLIAAVHPAPAPSTERPSLKLLPPV
jgi:hypothetical protein